jgi:Uma2 family endonuclease
LMCGEAVERMVAAVEMAHPAPWTVDEWATLVLSGVIDDGRRVEMVEGSLIVSPAPAMAHQVAADQLRTVLAEAAPADRLVVTAVGLPMPDVDSGFIPDILVVDRAAAREAGTLAGPSMVDLVVEVVSPSTVTTDRRVKPEKYAAAGIPTYWRLELNRFRGQLPGEVLPVLFAYALGDAGEYELVHRLDARKPGMLIAPFEVKLDLADLVL